MNNTAKEKLIVALDVRTSGEALELVNALSGSVGMFKVGSQLFTSAGPELVKKIVDTGKGVFLDLKFHDIPHQVAGATRAAAELGVSMLTVHASGGTEMLRRAADAVKGPGTVTKVLAVTVLTSIDASTLSEIGMNANPVESVKTLATLAESAGVDGVVASPQEVESLRSNLIRRDFLVVTPGIRPQNKNEEGRGLSEDQKRVATPRSALAAGADYLVVGRPITEARDVVAAAQAIVKQMEEAIEDLQRRGTAAV